MSCKCLFLLQRCNKQQYVLTAFALTVSMCCYGKRSVVYKKSLVTWSIWELVGPETYYNYFAWPDIESLYHQYSESSLIRTLINPNSRNDCYLSASVCSIRVFSWALYIINGFTNPNKFTNLNICQLENTTVQISQDLLQRFQRKCHCTLQFLLIKECAVLYAMHHAISSKSVVQMSPV